LFRVENDADGHGTFTAAGWWLSDRLEGASYRSVIGEVNAQARRSNLFRFNKKGPPALTKMAAGLSATLPEKRGPFEALARRKAGTDRVTATTSRTREFQKGARREE
jgi:hypothetical protein